MLPQLFYTVLTFKNLYDAVGRELLCSSFSLIWSYKFNTRGHLRFDIETFYDTVHAQLIEPQ